MKQSNFARCPSRTVQLRSLRINDGAISSVLQDHKQRFSKRENNSSTYGCGFEPTGVSIRCKFAEHAFSPTEFSARHVYSHSSLSLTDRIAKTYSSLSCVTRYFSLV